MPEVTVQRTADLVHKLFEILIQHPEGLRARDALAALQAQVSLTEHEKGRYPSGALRFDKIVRFATIDYVKAGWLMKESGRWSVTDAGKEAFARHRTPEAFYRAAAKLYREWKASRIEEETPVPGEAEEATEKVAAITFEEAQEQAWDDIDRYLSAMPPYEFQKLVASLLRAMGYHVSWVAPPGKDGGIDILALPDPLGTRSPRVKVQVRRVQHPVPVSDLRSFLALLGDGDVGLFVSTSGFTRDAEEEARTQEKRKVTLLDLRALLDLWITHLDKLDEEARARFPLRPIYFLLPED